MLLQFDTTIAETNLAQSDSPVCSFSKLILRFVPIPSVECLCCCISQHSAGTQRGYFAETMSSFAFVSLRREYLSCLFGLYFILFSANNRIWWLKSTTWDLKWIVCFLMKRYASPFPSPLHGYTYACIHTDTPGLHHTANCLYTCKQISSQIISYHQVGCGACCSRGWGCLSICQGQPDTKNKQHKPGTVVTRGRENLSGRSVWAGKMIMWHDTSEMRHRLPWWGVRRDYPSRGWNKTCFKWCLIRI